jgi:hypothetical protein
LNHDRDVRFMIQSDLIPINHIENKESHE